MWPHVLLLSELSTGFCVEKAAINLFRNLCAEFYSLVWGERRPQCWSALEIFILAGVEAALTVLTTI
jgi:hypothetical protein